MLRNKRTEARAHGNLAPLTELILRRLGPQGEAIRRRLQDFFRERAWRRPGEPEEEKARRGP